MTPAPDPAEPVGRSRLGRLEPAFAVLVTALATLSFGGFFAGWAGPAILAGAVLLGGAAGALSPRGRRRWVAVPVGLLGLAVALMAVCYPELTAFGLPTVQALAALGAGISTGLPKMLTVGLPADLRGDLLVLPSILGFAAGAAAVLLSTRTRSASAPAAPPLLVFLAGLLVTASLPQPRLLMAGGTALAVLGLLLLRSNRLAAASQEGIDAGQSDAVGVDLAARRWHSTMARVAFGLPAIAAATALAVGVAWLLPVDGPRADPRQLRDQPFRLAATLSPLVEVRPQLTEAPPRELFTVAVTGSDPLPDRVRTAALDSYDGALWTGSRDFQITGSTLPGFVPQDTPGQQIRLDVEVGRLVGPFLPVVGEPIRVDGADFAFSRSSGTAVRTVSSAEPFRYDVIGEVHRPDPALRQVEPPDPADPTVAALIALPAAPPWVRSVAEDVVQDRVTPMSQLLALEEYLHAQKYNPAAVPGHSYAALKRTLLGVPDERVGSAEQFAAAFAVLARSLGYPSRVAVGYLLRPEQRDGDRYRVLTADAHAWPEVRLAGYGWVPFEPTDRFGPVATLPQRSPEVTLAAADLDPPVVLPHQADDAATAARNVALAGIGLAAVLVLLGALVPMVKLLRRWRRARRGPPAQRLVAAWAEVVDRLRDARLPVPDSATTTEVAGMARSDVVAVAAAPAIAQLAPMVTGAVYAAEQPSEAGAAHAWMLAHDVRRRLGRAQGLGRRLLAGVDARTLLPHRRHSSTRWLPSWARGRKR